jgi:erythromycin esterase
MRLLIAFFLLVSSVGHGQKLSNSQLKFLQQAATVACSTTTADCDWTFIDQQVKDKKIILLGELNHGSKEIFLVRNSLIRYLHQRFGIKTILFESGIGELILADSERGSLTPAQMTNGFFGIWRTREFRELMEYVKANDLSISGFDVQRSGGSFSNVLRRIAANKKIDSMRYVDLENRYSVLNSALTNKAAQYDTLKSDVATLINDYQSLRELLVTVQPTNKSKELQLTLLTLQNRIAYLSYMLDFTRHGSFSKRWAARDSAMAATIKELIRTIYPNERVLVIAHNFHIAKYNATETVMGHLLAEDFRKQMYSMGIFAGSGSFHGNSGKEEWLVKPDSTRLDIKHLVQALPGTVQFIPMTGANSHSKWLDNDIVVNDTFINLNKGNTLSLRKSFDGIVLIRKISPPDR